MDEPPNGRSTPKQQSATIANFFGRIGRRIRSRSPVASAKQQRNGKAEKELSRGEHTPPRSQNESFDEKENSMYYTPPSTVSRFGAAWTRLSGRMKSSKKDKGSQENVRRGSADGGQPVQDLSRTPTHFSELVGSPRSAISESDLRHITLHRGIEAPSPLPGMQHAFISEDNLASGECGTGQLQTEHRTPSYLRISRALNGYTSTTPRRQYSDSPVRQLGQSLVERRLAQFREPCNNGSDSSTRSLTNQRNTQSTTPPHSELTPRAPRDMGADLSTPRPIKTLISQFDRLHLCSAEKSSSGAVDVACEKVQPHRIVINQPEPCCAEVPVSFGNEASTATIADTETDSQESASNSENKENGIIENSSRPASSICDEKKPPQLNGVNGHVQNGTSTQNDHSHIVAAEPTLTNGFVGKSSSPEADSLKSEGPNSGEDFARLLEDTTSQLQKRIDEAIGDLENDSSVTEEAASHLRVAIGKAQLLIRKKLAKFRELVHKNLNPIDGDPQPAKLDDLHGYWALIEIELTDVDECFQRVKQWKAAKWNLKEATQNGGTQPYVNGNGTANGATNGFVSTQAKQHLNGNDAAAVHIKPKVPAKPKLNAAQREQQTEKQKAAAEQRRKALEEAKLRGRKAQEKQATNGNGQASDSIMIL